MHTKIALYGLCLSIALLSGCGKPIDEPYVFDGPRPTGTSQDLDACKSIASTYKSDDIKDGAVTGAVIGSIAGALDDGPESDLEGALAGAALGAVVGMAEVQLDVEEQRRDVVIRRIHGRGYKIIG